MRWFRVRHAKADLPTLRYVSVLDGIMVGLGVLTGDIVMTGGTEIIANDPRDVRVIVVPFGMWSGEGSKGDFNSASLFHQTFHLKPLVGGYLSRVSPTEIRRQKQFPLADRLMRLSDGRPADRRLAT